MELVHKQGAIQTRLNDSKGIWCEACGKELIVEHKITIRSIGKRAIKGKGRSLTVPTGDLYTHLCIPCTKDLINCLHKSLGDAMLIPK